MEFQDRSPECFPSSSDHYPEALSRARGTHALTHILQQLQKMRETLPRFFHIVRHEQ
jgi:hypothetical protein